MNQQTRLEKLAKCLDTILTTPKINGTVDEFYGYEETHSGLWLSADDGNKIDDMSAFDYHLMDSDEKQYVMGVHKKIHEILCQQKAHTEYHDPATIMIYLD